VNSINAENKSFIYIPQQIYRLLSNFFALTKCNELARTISTVVLLENAITIRKIQSTPFHMGMHNSDKRFIRTVMIGKKHKAHLQFIRTSPFLYLNRTNFVWIKVFE